MKDAQLDLLAEQGLNVARFVSADPTGAVRHARISRDVSDSEGQDFHSLVATLFNSGVRSVNVRCFLPSGSRSNPFEYGISDADSAVDLAVKYMKDGYFVILNETIDVNDGGISGVSEGGVWEFAPGDTPRVVETGQVCRLPSGLAKTVIDTVYGSSPDIDDSTGSRRVEFSVHPSPVGYRASGTLVWEISDSPATSLQGPIVWPNPFSRHLGDKVFGLLIADAIGLPVPRALVIPRNVPPFEFGRETGSGEHWTRTAPTSPKPGLFTTLKGWTDVFSLTASEDPAEKLIASVIYQEGVSARYSGAAIPCKAPRKFLVEGVEGEGDHFMLGDVAPTDLPADVVSDVEALLQQASGAVGPARIEWAHDGSQAWVLQLHRAHDAVDPGVFHPGTPRNGWLPFEPSWGLQALSDVIRRAQEEGRGVRVTGPVGVTSHVGDLLRRSAIPSVVDWS